eukprot:Em0021g846a
MPPKSLVNAGAILLSFKPLASLASRPLQQQLFCRQIGTFNTEGLERRFEQRRQHIRKETEAWNTDTSAIFTNSELSLKRVDVYGFDFDYTLIHYTVELHKFIYENAKDYLIGKAGYPSGLKDMLYDPSFAIRGLHFDLKHGLLMKIDAYSHIQLTSVYRGHTPVSAEEVFKLYGGTHIPAHFLEATATDGRHTRLKQFIDLFSIPEVTLLADTSEYLLSKNIPFDSEYLFHDVQSAVAEVHRSGTLHKAITDHPERYVKSVPEIPQLLHRLKSDKKLFLVTNSPFWFVNQGMTYILGSKDWRDLFDVVIVSARKPSFYNDVNRPFRALNPVSLAPTWRRVTELSKDVVYHQGNMQEFINMTGWSGDRVLYFGDHVYTDLAEPILHHGWKTAAIIPELEDEIRLENSAIYKDNLSTLLAAESLLQHYQAGTNAHPDHMALLDKWKHERNLSRTKMKELFNTRFGSVFRTERGPTYFCQRLGRYASLYMSSISHLNSYPPTYTFYPRRVSLPHETFVNFDFLTANA